MRRANLSRRQGEALAQLRMFAGALGDDLAGYGVTVEEVVELEMAVEAFGEALAVAMEPATRTPVAVKVKDDAFVVAERLYRGLYSRIKWDEGICDELKVAAGVRPVNRERRRVGVPTAVPVVDILEARPWVHRLVYRSSEEMDRRGKPRGAVQLQLFVAVGDEPASDPGEAKLKGCYTRNPVQVGYGVEERGKTATYFARWVSARGEVGGWSLPKSMTVAG